MCSAPSRSVIAGAAADNFDIRSNYAKSEYQIAMRDGVKLYTAVYTPRGYTGTLPILLTRTPYGLAHTAPIAIQTGLARLHFARGEIHLRVSRCSRPLHV